MWVKAASFGLQVDLRLLSKNNCIRQKQLELLAKYSINQDGADFEPPVLGILNAAYVPVGPGYGIA